MVSKVYSATVQGINPTLVEVEVHSTLSDEFNMVVVGLPDMGVRESRDRAKAAILNSGLQVPFGKVTINLAPADIRKEGPSFDLPIAVAILLATDQIESQMCNGDSLKDYLFAGELALDGSIRPVHAVLSMALCAKESGKRGIFVPTENAAEAAMIEGIEVYPIQNLAQLVSFLRIKPGAENLDDLIAPVTIDVRELFNHHPENELDFAEVKGQESVKRALEVAAAGGHNILLVGPPGAGKSMLAKRLPGILPPLTMAEALEVTQIHSIMGLLKGDQPLVTQRPFRAPHHTASTVGLLGGGSNPAPGEITLAHHGVLFLDELPEFKRTTLETMRQPLEEGYVTISRSAGTVTFPAQFMLVAAMNPSPDGRMPHESRSNPLQIRHYLNRISGPLLDRIDLHVEVPAVRFRDISDHSGTVTEGESSATIRARVIAARQRQTSRFAETPQITCNARMGSRELRKFCTLSDECLNLLKMAMNEMQLSARAYDRIRKVARTIADMDGSDEIMPQHVMEASQYRNLDRQIWDFR